MFVVRLFCNQGMSTSILVSKMKMAAKKEGLDADIAAYPIGELNDRIKGIDVALLGPQVGYMKAKVRPLCASAGVAMDVIPMKEYGRCDGDAVMRFALQLAGK
ncbi:MAG: PTS sugar transporter subunit IIB [Candidatus Weimeria sp.]